MEQKRIIIGIFTAGAQSPRHARDDHNRLKRDPFQYLLRFRERNAAPEKHTEPAGAAAEDRDVQIPCPRQFSGQRAGCAGPEPGLQSAGRTVRAELP